MLIDDQAMIAAGLAVLEGPNASPNARDEAGVNRFFNFPHVRFTGAGELKIPRILATSISRIFVNAEN